MKNLVSLLLLTCMVLLASTGGHSVRACDRTNFGLDSVVFAGGLYTIYTTVCIGGGVQGVNKGAGGDTRDMAFGFYTPGAVPITISAFTPASITGDTTGCQYFGGNAGAFAPNPPFLAQGLIGYQDLFGCAAGYQCIGSQAVCGNLHSQCTQFTFTVDVVPDSIRLFGAEGGGNPVAGCYPNPDMLVDFTVLPVVWGDFYGQQGREGLQLHWSTLSEINNDHFEIMRSADGENFQRIGEIPGNVNTTQIMNYSFLDRNPVPGMAQYKIRQVDIDGGQDETEVISLSYAAPAGLSWLEVGPVPTAGPVNLNFLSDKDQALNLMVFDVKGEMVIQQVVDAKVGSNQLHMSLADFGSGVYYLRMRGAGQNLDYKLMKL